MNKISNSTNENEDGELGMLMLMSSRLQEPTLKIRLHQELITSKTQLLNARGS